MEDNKRENMRETKIERGRKRDLDREKMVWGKPNPASKASLRHSMERWGKRRQDDVANAANAKPSDREARAC